MSLQPQQFTTFNTWYCPGGGTSAAERRLEGGVQDRKGRPAYTLEQYLAGNAPYVTVAMDSKVLPYGTLLYNGKFKDQNGALIPFRVTDTGGAFKGVGFAKMDIASSSLERARQGPNFNGVWQVAGGQNAMIAPTETAPAMLPNPNVCEGLSNNDLFSPPSFNFNNSPTPANGTPLPPGAVGGGGITTKYIPEELKQYGNGRLPISILTELSFAKGALMYRTAAQAFEQLVAAAKGQGLQFPGITDHYRSIERQMKLKRDKPSLAATPGKSMHGWGLALDINNGNRGVFNPFLQFLKKNAYKFNIYALAKVKGDAFYAQGFWNGEEWHWEYRGPTPPIST